MGFFFSLIVVIVVNFISLHQWHWKGYCDFENCRRKEKQDYSNDENSATNLGEWDHSVRVVIALRNRSYPLGHICLSE